MEHRPIAQLSVPVVGMGTSRTLDLPESDQELAEAVSGRWRNGALRR